MAKKILLKSRPEPVSFTMIGISCHLMDYRLLHELNKELGFSFVREEDLPVHLTTEKEIQEFSLFLYRDEDHRNTFFLIANFSHDTVLIPEFRNTDFILLIEGDIKKQRKEALLKQIRLSQGVLTAFEINFKDIKKSDVFLTDLEMHVSEIRKQRRHKPLVKTK